MKAFRFALLVLALVPTACAAPHNKTTKAPSAAKPAEPALTAEERQKNLDSFDIVWTTIRDKHFDPKLNGVDWNAARDELRPKVENAKTMSEAREAMNELLHRLHQTHFGIIPKSAYELMSKGSTANGVSGIDARVLDGHAIVTSVEENSGGAEAGVKPGWELIDANGEEIAPALAKISETFADSTLKDIMLSRTAVAHLRGDVGTSVPATFIDGAGKQVQIQIPMKAPTGEAFKFGNMPNIYVRYQAKRVPSPGSNIGYVSISAFMLPSIVQQFRASLESFKDTDGLIIDLRGNPGGIGALAIGMSNLLVSERGKKLGTMTMRNGSFSFTVDPQSLNYAKPVAVLIDGCSGSTSEILAQGLHDLGRARLIGTMTAGAALPSRVDELPNGDGFQYAFANYTSAGGEVLEGHGVKPDDVVPLTREALLAGHDPPLDTAIKWIRSQKK